MIMVKIIMTISKQFCNDNNNINDNNDNGNDDDNKNKNDNANGNINDNDDNDNTRIEACVADVRVWMNYNFLKLNDDKTELLIITTREELSKISDISITVGDQSISPSDDPQRNIGVIFDSI